MEKQINRLVQTCHYHRQNIGSIRKVLTKDAIATLVWTLILSRLDYCKSSLFGISSSQLHRLHKIQNKAARIITLTSPRCHTYPILKSLHWLRIRERTDFKILCLTYQSFYNSGPSYLQDLLTHYSPERTLRTSQRLLLAVPSYNLKSFGFFTTFSYAAASLWNCLPVEFRSSLSLSTFKSRLKTHLFLRYTWRITICTY
ncbi:uncharacterized protein [Haliotis asinina]|uniref:uncharacterized protein n=1 Tax=Haliotis asinina TaxID=109174 RepID=UPI003531AF67